MKNDIYETTNMFKLLIKQNMLPIIKIDLDDLL